MPNLAPQMTKPEKTDKQPSRFFTEYYSAAFLFLISAFVILAFVFVKPLIDQIKETNAMTQAEVGTTDSERAYLNSLDASIAAAETISPTVLDRVSLALPSDANTPSLLVQFGSAAYSNGVRIDNVAFNEGKAAAKAASGVATTQVVPLDITLAVHARSYFDIKRFLSALETSLRVMDVQGMTASGGEGDSFYSLQLRSYVFSSPSPTVKP